jgi:transcriptional antiterminator RfaH
MNWYAIYTKPTYEDSTALLLRNAGIQTLTPKIMIKRYYRGKYTSIVEPLFPSYIFACFDPESHAHMIRYTRGVRYIVGKQNPLAVPQVIIDILFKTMEGDMVKPVREELEKGDRVLVKEGPFANFCGIFERDLPGRQRSMILLEALHWKLEIENESIRKA